MKKMPEGRADIFLAYCTGARDAQKENSARQTIALPDALAGYLAPKGSITVDGVSLTVNEVEEGYFGVNLIPHTVEHTAFHARRVGDAVNIEVDVVARYIERLLSHGETPRLDEAFLKQHGFA